MCTHLLVALAADAGVVIGAGRDGNQGRQLQLGPTMD